MNLSIHRFGYAEEGETVRGYGAEGKEKGSLQIRCRKYSDEVGKGGLAGNESKKTWFS